MSKAELIERQFVAGMDWRQSVQSIDRKKDALARARKQRANWYTTIGQHTIGIAAVRAKPAKGEPFYSLAAGFAALCGTGYGFAAVRLADQRIWICGAIDAAPAAGNDQVVRSGEIARERLQHFLGQVDGSCAVYTNDPGLLDGLAGTIQQHAADLTDIKQAAVAQAPLTRVGSSVPAPLLGIVLFALVGVAGFKGYQYWQLQQRIKTDAAAAASTHVDAAVVWRRAYDELAQQQVIVGPAGLRQLRDAIAELPTSIAGWRLAQADCAAALEAWSCALSYERVTNVGLDPTNAEFEQLRPRHWQHVQFPTINLASAAITVPSAGHVLDLDALPHVWERQIEGASAIQRVLRAFGSNEQGGYEELVPTIPVDGNGEPVPKPDELQLAVLKSSTTLSGPLRSVDVLVDDSVPMAWRSLRLDVEPIPSDWRESGRPGLIDSLLKATLTGDVYAKR
ncbi:hypothetical protein D8I35_03310 [Corticibacter populi]|uniref:Type 4b pilus protein PilO2 n=1 Tax=Corticibacter populi TaxID=1550736 RepID=A0A3M6QYV6_9BURK|nr:type 4b pilus protein PilO2 [Corticibacter populi]RMX08158.1 hypothetical protein D8I35_03310 [Corticibacter populi]RZS35419.1 pilin accessory protein (PilO) [Corticibacter populi]